MVYQGVRDNRWSDMGRMFGGGISQGIDKEINQRNRQENMDKDNALRQANIDKRFQMLQAQRDHEMKALQDQKRLQSGIMFGATMPNAGANNQGTIKIDGQYNPSNTGLSQKTLNQMKMQYDSGLTAPREPTAIKPQFDFQGGNVFKDGVKTTETYNPSVSSGGSDAKMRHINAKHALLEKKRTKGLTEGEELELKDIEKLVTQDNSPSMISDAKREEFFKEKILSYRSKLPEELQEQDYTTFDTRGLERKDKNSLNIIAKTMIRKNNPNMAKKALEDVRKTLVSVDQLSQSFRATQKLADGDKNINFIDKTVRDAFSAYTGMNDNELETAFRDKRYASAANVIKNALFGASQSVHEMKSFRDATASLYQTDKGLVMGMRSMLEDVKAKLKVNETFISPEPFNLLFGDKVRNIDALIESMSGFVSGEGDGSQISDADKILQLRNERDNATSQSDAVGDGTVIVNPTTNERMILKNGTWEKI